MLHTTFSLLRKHGACKPGYRKLAKALGGIQKHGINTPIPLIAVMNSNGLGHALWCLRAVLPAEVTDCDRIARLFSCRCVRETPSADGRTTWDLLIDERSRNAVIVSERFVRGGATADELAATWAIAYAAARGIVGASEQATAYAAASAAAWADVGVAAWAALGTAALAATGAATGATVWATHAEFFKQAISRN